MGKKSQQFVLFDTSSGFALFEVVGGEEIASNEDAVQKSISDLGKFSKLVKLKAFAPFTSAEEALANAQAMEMGELTDFLRNFLEMNLPKAKEGKKNRVVLGVLDNDIGHAVQNTLGVKCQNNTAVLEMVRGCRTHFTHFIKQLSPQDLHQAQLGLSHSYSRARVKFNVNRVDNMIIQSIALLDQLDKDVNTFAMRLKEWYGWTFPELVKVVPDSYQYARLAKAIGDKASLTEESLPMIEEIVMDEDKAKEVLAAARMSMGQEISEIDLENVNDFADRVIGMAQYRSKLHSYLVSKMNSCAPNLTALIGEQVGARLISHAGSLTNLAKYPASTVQILGAEKALFRALKTKGATPKYGLLYHSTFIGRAATKNKGRISRYLANKCSIASRIDAFTEEPSSVYGHKLREQVEERLSFYKEGKAPRKNIDVMQAAKNELDETTGDGSSGAEAKTQEQDASDSDKKKKSKKAKKSKKNKKRKADEAGITEADVADEEHVAKKKKTKKSKKKKSKKSKSTE
eukprot:TRINITY_DN66917_c10_g1_i1.p1 TRINITY_DN66917_c10_g1~~TRINITY_DN66917_c10_g1_i1.p1  ORF type:complete len:527 (-),score=343.95 TRINITY_DN66917_c10_g1_i1:50-1597(-)